MSVCPLSEITDSKFPALTWVSCSASLFFLFTVLRLASDNFLLLHLVHVGLIMKGTLAKRGRQCSSLEKEVAKAMADRATLEKQLTEAEARLGWAITEKAATESAEEASRIEVD